MIGDVVSVVPSGQPIHISAIHNGKVGYHAVTHKLEWVRIGLLRPIPLTAEILEKNGFDSDRDNNIFAYNEGMAFVEVSLASNYINIDYDCTDEYGASSTFIKPDVSALYVHDIQHFLRICGFKKEIEL